VTQAGAGSQTLDETDVLLLKAVADIGMIAGVAAAVGLTPSAVVRRLARLERRVDGRLVRGDGGRLWLTMAGRTLLAAGLEFLEAVAAGARRMSDAEADRPPDLPRLRIAGFGTNWSGLVDDLAARLPGLLVDVHSAEPGAAEEIYARGRADAVYLWEVSGEPAVLNRPARTYAVLDEPLWVALPATHPSAGRAAVALHTLAAQSWILGPTGLSERLLRAVCRAAGFAPRIGATVDSAPAGRSMIGHGLGIALVSPLTAVPGAGARMVFRPLAGPPRRRLVLAVDGAVVGDRLARFLLERLRHGYATTAASRNPEYRRSNDFPVDAGASAMAGAPDAGLLNGLRAAAVAPEASTPRTGSIGLEDLHVLRVVAATGSVNRAARKLLISQPALSRRISRLERDLGARLFVRSHRGSTLAPGAHLLLDELDDAEANLRAALRSIVDKPVNGTSM
jgi:DNA-binding transcriptional LysR family regulator